MIAVYEHRFEHAAPWLEAFCSGLRRHGVPHVRVPQGEIVDADCAVFWSIKRDDVIDRQKKRGRRYLVLELGYMGDRHHWASIGYDGLNGRADFCTDNVPGDRWEKHFAHLMRPWRTGGRGCDLVIGQVPGDASIGHINIMSWLGDIARALDGRDMVFRPHPLAADMPTPRGMRRSMGCLVGDLRSARRVITFNSNVGVDAILHGVPVVAFDQGSMVRSVARHGLPGWPVYPDRTAWAHRMAYCQWTRDEIANGDAWEHLKRGLA